MIVTTELSTLRHYRLVNQLHQVMDAVVIMIQSIILSMLIIIPSGECCTMNIYYVEPTSGLDQQHNVSGHKENCSNISMTCKTLKEYQELGNFTECDYKSNKPFVTIITIKFLVGIHEARSDVPIRFNNVEGMRFIGLGDSDQIIIKNLDLGIITGSVVIRNITMQGNDILTYRSSSPNVFYQPVKLINSRFAATQMILPNVKLTIKNSEFQKSSSTAITLYSSFVVLKGKVIFSNNTGIKGGALALIGSTLIIKRKTSVLFSNNHALETGGAIYVDNVEPRVNLDGFRPYCFYLLHSNKTNVLDDNFAQALNFDNNTASLGDNHIYGAVLKSNCVSSSFCHDENCRSSFDTFRKRLTLIQISAILGQLYQEILHVSAYVTTAVYHNAQMLQ